MNFHRVSVSSAGVVLWIQPQVWHPWQNKNAFLVSSSNSNCLVAEDKTCPVPRIMCDHKVFRSFRTLEGSNRNVRFDSAHFAYPFPLPGLQWSCSWKTSKKNLACPFRVYPPPPGGQLSQNNTQHNTQPEYSQPQHNRRFILPTPLPTFATGGNSEPLNHQYNIPTSNRFSELSN